MNYSYKNYYKGSIPYSSLLCYLDCVLVAVNPPLHQQRYTNLPASLPLTIIFYKRAGVYTPWMELWLGLWLRLVASKFRAWVKSNGYLYTFISAEWNAPLRPTLTLPKVVFTTASLHIATSELIGHGGSCNSRPTSSHSASCWLTTVCPISMITLSVCRYTHYCGGVSCPQMSIIEYIRPHSWLDQAASKRLQHLQKLCPH